MVVVVGYDGGAGDSVITTGGSMHLAWLRLYIGGTAELDGGEAVWGLLDHPETLRGSQQLDGADYDATLLDDLGQHHFVLVHGGESDEGVPVDQLDDLGRGWFQPRSGRRLGGNNLDFVPASVGDRRRAQTVLRRPVGGGSVDQFFAVGDDRRGRQGKCSRAVGAGRSDDLQAGRRTRN